MKQRILHAFILISLGSMLVGCGTKQNNSSSSNNQENIGTSANQTNNLTQNTETPQTTEDFEEKTTAEGTKKTEVDKSIRMYLYNAKSDKIVYFDKTIKVTDGALVTAIIETFKEDTSNEYSTLPKDVAVKSAKLDKSKDLLTVNFGSKFVNTMNLGSGIETQTIKSIVNTLGYNFGISNVYITVDGKSYSSGHIIMKEGEAFKVSYENCTIRDFANK